MESGIQDNNELRRLRNGSGGTNTDLCCFSKDAKKKEEISPIPNPNAKMNCGC